MNHKINSIENRLSAAAIVAVVVLAVLSLSACSGPNSGDDGTSQQSSKPQYGRVSDSDNPDYTRENPNTLPGRAIPGTLSGHTVPYTSAGRTSGPTAPANPSYDRPGATMPIGTTTNN